MSQFSSKELAAWLEVALTAATEGGHLLQKYWGNLHDVRSKDVLGNLVTEADNASEEKILEVLRRHVPEHSVLAEESGIHEVAGADFLWAVDPLDGTVNYAHKLPLVCVSIGLLYKGRPLVGVVYNPILGQLFQAVRGGGATLDGKPIRVSTEQTLRNSLLTTGFPYHRRRSPHNNYEEFSRLTDRTQGVRRLGSAALDLAYVASGSLDGYWEWGINAWDIAAGALLVEEAGGKVTGSKGEPIDYFAGWIVATNGAVHEELCKTLSEKEAHDTL